MKLVAWDTSSKAGTVVALEWDEKSADARSTLRLVGEWILSVDAAHSDRLLWAIDQVIQSAHWDLKDVDYLAVGIGPGSFTGLRIGVTTARSLAHTLDKPLVEVSSLAALARPVAEWALHTPGCVVIAATDACKGELFALSGIAKSVRECVVHSNGDRKGVWGRGTDEEVYRHEALIQLLKKKTSAKNARWIAVGESRKRHPDFWSQLSAKKELEYTMPFSDQIQGKYLGLLAWEAIQSGVFRKALDVTPRYLRASEAEVKLKERNQKQKAKA